MKSNLILWGSALCNKNLAETAIVKSISLHVCLNCSFFLMNLTLNLYNKKHCRKLI